MQSITKAGILPSEKFLRFIFSHARGLHQTELCVNLNTWKIHTLKIHTLKIRVHTLEYFNFIAEEYAKGRPGTLPT